uniref:sodium/hydrogen exchanger 9B2-like isoform X1 n=1 Tax=Oncorhynchus gorbuscha TaxID=8017 RepID=UPI001EAEB572|nr:sodium/hydrogen exchanger 9B2-like isoform X1 [Oncorhynchus gorbuscha]
MCVCVQVRGMLDCSPCCSWVSRLKCPRPHGFLAHVITKVCLGALLFGVVWSIAEKECYPGGNLFGIIILFLCAVCGGKLVGLIQLPTLPPFPPLVGMLLAGLVLRNVPYVTEAVHIEQTWSAALRNIALAIILTRAGLGLDPSALRRLKAVCVRLAVGPCTVEASTVAVMSHFLMGLPWVWGFVLGFVLSAVSPAVVVPSMLLLQKDGYGVEKGIPTLLMAAGSFDDILAITAFTTSLGVAFASGGIGIEEKCHVTGSVCVCCVWEPCSRVLWCRGTLYSGHGIHSCAGLGGSEGPSSSSGREVLGHLPTVTVWTGRSTNHSIYTGPQHSGSGHGMSRDRSGYQGSLHLSHGVLWWIQHKGEAVYLCGLASQGHSTAPLGALGIGLAGPRLLTRHPEDTHADRKEGDLEADTETPQKDMVTLESKL